MSIGDVVSAAQSAAGTVSGAVSAVSGLAKFFGSSAGGGITFKNELRKSSWRGLPFVTLSSETHFGRRKAIHEYPYRDLPWIEDLGRKTRQIKITGFLIGEDAIIQRNAMFLACEKPGPGEVVHGTHGRFTADLIEFSITERWDEERYFELSFSFAQGGQRIYPTAAPSTANAVQAAATVAHAAASASFMSTALTALKSGAAVVGMAVSTVSMWARTATTLVNDATSIYHTIAAIPSAIGQFFGSRRTGAAGFASGIQGAASSIQRAASGISGAASTVQSLGALATVTRSTVSTAASTLSSIAGLLGL